MTPQARFTNNDNDGQFSTTYQEVMSSIKKEIKEDSGSVCSTCSSCDTCSTDTWEALGIDEVKIAQVTPRPLPPDVEREMTDKLSELCVEKLQRQRRPQSPALAVESGTESRELTVRSPGADSDRLSRRSHRTPGGSRKTPSKTTRGLDAMSGLWNMLATYDEFVVTPPGFNLYQQDKPHWLDQEPIPWEERERARRKCVKWLRNYHQTA
ncbi:uncharacterized protein LOC129000711 isoform X2 [Macrosteles quadrilineatus]|uniref:uncharacterized protein LOC129000711 isoform X2 n=1 Tax=Macrosteles quadrilineatus TaxID=74068 RepID=UPI0023E0A2B9|nr:uncharacterized protein LOC129000711 isoform X2 [Macrosteles quadrilineatus]